MDIGGTWRALGRNETVRTALFVLGCLLILSAPLVGFLPGPGGVIVAAAGLSLALKNSAWAKRRYVHFKKRWPRYGGWCDWGMRRKSARRRQALAKEAQAQAQAD
jgi:hypothetical protein